MCQYNHCFIKLSTVLMFMHVCISGLVTWQSSSISTVRQDTETLHFTLLCEFLHGVVDGVKTEVCCDVAFIAVHFGVHFATGYWSMIME